jgi:hypothetical protein
LTENEIANISDDVWHPENERKKHDERRRKEHREGQRRGRVAAHDPGDAPVTRRKHGT